MHEIIKRGSGIFPAIDLQTLQACIQCGTCVGSCPSGRRTAWRIRNILLKVQLGLRDEVLSSDDLWLCTTCYTCQERCPRKVPATDIVRLLRNIAFEEGHVKKEHLTVVRNFITTGHAVLLTDEVKKARVKLGLEELPPTTLKFTEWLEKINKILEVDGFKNKTPK